MNSCPLAMLWGLLSAGRDADLSHVGTRPTGTSERRISDAPTLTAPAERNRQSGGGGCFIVRQDSYGGGQWDGDQLEFWPTDHMARTTVIREDDYQREPCPRHAGCGRRASRRVTRASRPSATCLVSFSSRNVGKPLLHPGAGRAQTSRPEVRKSGPRFCTPARASGPSLTGADRSRGGGDAALQASARIGP